MPKGTVLFYFVLENLVLRARSELHGFAGKDGERLEVSVFRFQLLCFFFLTPDTRHLKP
jgi:hypothetical protein